MSREDYAGLVHGLHCMARWQTMTSEFDASDHIAHQAATAITSLIADRDAARTMLMATGQAAATHLKRALAAEAKVAMLQRDTITGIAKMAHAIGWQAGVGGMETAGGIVSYLAQHPDLIPLAMERGMMAEGVSRHWLIEGCLTWHSAKDGEIIHPADRRAAIRQPRSEGGV